MLFMHQGHKLRTKNWWSCSFFIITVARRSIALMLFNDGWQQQTAAQRIYVQGCYRSTYLAKCLISSSSICLFFSGSRCTRAWISVTLTSGLSISGQRQRETQKKCTSVCHGHIPFRACQQQKRNNERGNGRICRWKTRRTSDSILLLSKMSHAATSVYWAKTWCRED